MARVFAAYRTTQISIEFQRRSDTRLYLGDQDEDIEPGFGRCVGAFFLINPGTADPIKSGRARTTWGALKYGSERLLPHLDNVLAQALDVVEGGNPSEARRLKKDAYVQILNLAYVRSSSNAGYALEVWRRVVSEASDVDDSPRVTKPLRFVVFGWGGQYRPNQDESRVVHVLKSCVGERTRLFFPSNAAIRGAEPVRQQLAELDDLHRQIARNRSPGPVYPCGGRSAGEAFLASYTCLMGPLIGNALLAK